MNKKYWKFTYALLSLLGMFSALWGHETYLLTFINPTVLIVICLIPTFPTYLAIRNHYVEIYKTGRTYFPFLQSLFSVGLFTASIFIISNYQFSSSQLITEVYNIEKTGTLAGIYRRPYAIIERQGSTKKLLFKGNPTINPEDQIKLTVKKGFFGFDTIAEQLIIRKD